MTKGINAELLDYMGDDLAVANAARVSFNKESEHFTFRKDVEKGSDEGLIEYLAKYDHWCYDDKTEVFTQRGWVKFIDVGFEDKVAQVHGWEQDDFKFDFVTPLEIHKNWYEGVMYEVDSSKISYSVTPHHKMLYMGRNSKGLKNLWEVGNSDKIFGKFKRLKTAAKYSDDQLSPRDLLEGKLVGFLLGDGFHSLKYNNPRTVYVRLKVERKIEYLTELLEELGIRFKKVQDKRGVTIFTIDYKLNMYQNSEKYFSVEDAIGRGYSFCKGLYEGLLNSDGSVKRKTFTFSSSSESLIELFCAVSTLLGQNPIMNKPRHMENPKHRTNYRVMLQTRDVFTVNSGKSAGCKEVERDYKGYVCCVSVPSGMLLVRRNGLQMVCGNTPFSHTAIKLRCSAPVPIRTQAFKHKIGMVENEESRRYISSTPEIFIPDFFRVKPEGSIKQGSAGEHPYNSSWLHNYKAITESAVKAYEDMIEDGVCPEQARFILPQGTIVNWIWTGNLVSFANFYNKRTDPTAQKEVKILAEMVGEIVQPLFPVSWKALTKNKEPQHD